MVTKWFMFTFLLFSFLLTGCSGEQSDQNTNGPAKETLASLAKDAKEVNVTLPSFVSESPAIVQETYALAFANQETLNYMPCFCGCVNSGHQSNRDCYIKDARQNGAVVWDNMSAT